MCDEIRAYNKKSQAFQEQQRASVFSSNGFVAYCYVQLSLDAYFSPISNKLFHLFVRPWIALSHLQTSQLHMLPLTNALPSTMQLTRQSCTLVKWLEHGLGLDATLSSDKLVRNQFITREKCFVETAF